MTSMTPTQKIVSSLVALTIIGLCAGLVHASYASAAATFRVVQTPSLHLYSGLSAVATSMRVTPYPVDLDSVKLTITDFGSSPTVTIDPKVSTYEEIVGFTGIVDNGDNTATLTGLTRDLQSKYPYSSSGSGKQHGSGAVVVFSNNPQIYGRLAAPENTQSWTGQQTFSSSSMPLYDIDPSAAQWASATGRELVDLSKLNATAIAGAANASESTNGISQLATGLQLASSTRLGSTGARLILPASLATSTPGLNATTTIPVTQSNGKLSQSFYDLTQNYSYSGKYNLAATTTIAASSTVGNALILNNLPYAVSSSRGASSTVLTENGSGNLSWLPVVHALAVAGPSAATAAVASTTLATVLIPANTITTSSQLQISSVWSGQQAGGNCLYSIAFGNSTGTSTIGFAQAGSGNIALINGSISATSTTNGISVMHGNLNANNNYILDSSGSQSGYSYGYYLSYNFATTNYIAFQAYNSSAVNCALSTYSVHVIQ